MSAATDVQLEKLDKRIGLELLLGDHRFLLNEALVSDPDEAFELSDAHNLLLTDDEIKGSRLQVLLRAVEPVKVHWQASMVFWLNLAYLDS